MSSQYKIDEPIPNFKINATNDLKTTFSNLLNKNIVLFFYPKDNTPVCTSEAKAFRDHFKGFSDLDTLVFGVSRDNIASHERFKARLELPFELISDTTEELCAYFDVIKEKNFFGKKIHSIERSTFLIDKEGILKQVWKKVKVNGHIDEVLTAIGHL